MFDITIAGNFGAGAAEVMASSARASAEVTETWARSANDSNPTGF